jgi:hypothetical protein
MTSGIKNKIVTSIYDLNYINERGGMIYKSFDLLTLTFRNVIFSDYDYIIYTDHRTYNNHNFSDFFERPNVTIKFLELNGDLYNELINPLRLKKIQSGDIWDRIHSVNNYVEVMYNKFEIILKECENFDGSLVWIDSGLFGTSCSDGWRDYMVKIAHTEYFFKKIFEKIELYDLISLKGNAITINYEDKNKINNLFNLNCEIVPGGLFGGKSSDVLNCFSTYKEIIKKMVNCGFYTSDQEILYILLSNQERKMFFEFDDWVDFQKGILKIMDLYDENEYSTHECYKKIIR